MEEEIVPIDEIDVKILRELIKDARKKLKDIANEIGFSTVATFKRINRLKAKGVITETTIVKDVNLLGHPYPALIGVNLEGNPETIAEELTSEQYNLAGISPSVGKYDLCVFVVATSIQELNALRRHIREKEGVKRVAVNIWTESHFNFDNFELISSGE
jgi:DNA-binding Lrp family transcriptional regulator